MLKLREWHIFDRHLEGSLVMHSFHLFVRHDLRIGLSLRVQERKKKYGVCKEEERTWNDLQSHVLEPAYITTGPTVMASRQLRGTSAKRGDPASNPSY